MMTRLTIFLILTAALASAQGPTYPYTVNLNFTASTGIVMGYNMYRAPFTTACGTYAKLNASPFTGTSYTDQNPPQGFYCYAATAVDGPQESGFSNIDSNISHPPAAAHRPRRDLAGKIVIKSSGRGRNRLASRLPAIRCIAAQRMAATSCAGIVRRPRPRPKWPCCPERIAAPLQPAPRTPPAGFRMWRKWWCREHLPKGHVMKFYFHGYTVRLTSEADLPLAIAWSARALDAGFWLKQEPGCESFLVSERVDETLASHPAISKVVSKTNIRLHFSRLSTWSAHDRRCASPCRHRPRPALKNFCGQ